MSTVTVFTTAMREGGGLQSLYLLQPRGNGVSTVYVFTTVMREEGVYGICIYYSHEERGCLQCMHLQQP